jgi:hypothetical protein
MTLRDPMRMQRGVLVDLRTRSERMRSLPADEACVPLVLSAVAGPGRGSRPSSAAVDAQAG